jgi:hypothetical protein
MGHAPDRSRRCDSCEAGPAPAVRLRHQPRRTEWTKHDKNPIFRPNPRNTWEKDRVTGCQVIRHGNWQRHRANPIIQPGKGKGGSDAGYKPFALFDGKRWLLWYNGRKGGNDRIGVAFHQGEDLGF